MAKTTTSPPPVVTLKRLEDYIAGTESKHPPSRDELLSFIDRAIGRAEELTRPAGGGWRSGRVRVVGNGDDDDYHDWNTLREKALVLVARLVPLYEQLSAQLEKLNERERNFDNIYHAAMRAEQPERIARFAGHMEMVMMLGQSGTIERRSPQLARVLEHEAEAKRRIQYETEQQLQLLQSELQKAKAEIAAVTTMTTSPQAVASQPPQPEQQAQPQSQPHVLYRQEMIRCGKVGCKKCADAKSGHGPYWYAYLAKNGKKSKSYVGKELPKNIQTEQHTIRHYVATNTSTQSELS